MANKDIFDSPRVNPFGEYAKEPSTTTTELLQQEGVDITEIPSLKSMRDYDQAQEEVYSNLIDADTLLGSKFGTDSNIRLKGFNAPEIKYKDEDEYIQALAKGEVSPLEQVGQIAKSTVAQELLRSKVDGKALLLQSSKRDKYNRLLGKVGIVEESTQDGIKLRDLSNTALAEGSSNVWIDKGASFKELAEQSELEKDIIVQALAKAESTNDPLDWARYENLLNRSKGLYTDELKDQKLPVAKTIGNALVGAGEVVSKGANYVLEGLSKAPQYLFKTYKPGEGWIVTEDMKELHDMFKPVADAIQLKEVTPEQVENSFKPIRETLNNTFNTDIFNKMEVTELPSVAKAIHDWDNGRTGNAVVGIANSVLQGIVNEENAAMVVPGVGMGLLIGSKAKEFEADGADTTKALAYATAYGLLNRLSLNASLGTIKNIGKAMLTKAGTNAGIETLTENLQTILELDAAGKIKTKEDLIKAIKDTTRETAPSALFGGGMSVARDVKNVAGEKLQSKLEEIQLKKQAKEEQGYTPEHKEVRQTLAKDAQLIVNTIKKEERVATVDEVTALRDIQLEAEANGDKALANRVKEANKVLVAQLKGSTEKFEAPTLANEQETLDYVNELLTSATQEDIQDSNLIANIKAIGAKNGVDVAKIEATLKDHQAVERDVTVGPTGYKTYERTLRQLNKEPEKNATKIATVMKNYNRLYTSQVDKVNAIETAIEEAKAQASVGTLYNKQIKIPAIKTQAGKPWVMNVKVTEDGDIEVHPSTMQVLDSAKKTVAAMEAISQGLNTELNREAGTRDVVQETISEKEVTIPEKAKERKNLKNGTTVAAPLQPEDTTITGKQVREASKKKYATVKEVPTKELENLVTKIEKDILPKATDKAKIKSIQAKLAEAKQELDRRATEASKETVQEKEAKVETEPKDNKQASTLKKYIVATLDTTLLANKAKEDVQQQFPVARFVSEDGTIDAELMRAMAVVAKEFLVSEVASLQDNYIRNIQSKLGYSSSISIPANVYEEMAEIGTYYAQLADRLGASIIKELGISTKSEEANYKERLAVSLGSQLLEALQEAGAVTIKEDFTVGKYKELKQEVAKYNKSSVDLEQITSYDRESKDTVVIRTVEVGPKAEAWQDTAEQAEGLEAKEQDFTKEPRTEQDTGTRGHKIRRKEKFYKIPKFVQKVLRKVQQLAYSYDTEVMTAFNDVDESTMKELLGWKESSTVRADRQKEVEGKNRQIEKSIKDLKDGYTKFDKAKLYFNYFLSSNGRFFIDSNTLNPQNNKLHRFIVKSADATVALTKKNTDTWKLAVVQAFDGLKAKKVLEVGVDTEAGTESKDPGAVDKQTLVQSLEDFNELTNKTLAGAIEDIQAYLNGNKEAINSARVKEALRVDHPTHALNALLDLAKYKNGELKTTSLTIESDAVTSGFILSMLTMPVMTLDKVKKWLAKGGIWLGGTDYQGYGEQRGSGVTDSYEEGAVGSNARLEEIGNTLSWVVESINRKFMKNPLMVFNYGAGIASIKRAIGSSIADEVLDRLADNKLRKETITKVQETLTASDKALKDANVKLEAQLKEVQDDREANKIKAQIYGNSKQLKANAKARYAIKQVDAKAWFNESMFKNKYIKAVYNAIEAEAERTFGEAITGYLSTEFSELVEVRKLINKSMVELFNKFKKEYDKRTKDLTKQEDIDAVLDEMVRNGEVPGIFTVYSEFQDEKASIIDSRRDLSTNIKDRVRVSAKGKKRNVNPVIREMIAAPSSGGVTSIHWLDGGIMAAVLNETNALGIHDALLSNINSAVENAVKYNQAVWDKATQYNLLQELADTMKEAFPNAEDELADTIVMLAKAATASNINKAKIQEIGADVEHMAMPGSKISIYGKAKEDMLANEDIDSMLEAEVKDVLGDTLVVQFNGSRNPRNYQVLAIDSIDVKNNGKEITIHTDRGQYTFKDGKNVSEKTARGHWILESRMQSVYSRLEALMNEDFSTEMNELGKLEAGALESTEGMLKVFDKLGDMAVEPDTVHQTHLRGLLQQVDEKFLPKMKLYLNEKANRNKGLLYIKSKAISLGINEGALVDNEMTAQETYVHELMHAFTVYAMDSKDIEAKRLLSQITAIQKQAEKKIKKEDLPKGKWEYIFEGKNSLAEFIAYSLTNKEVMAELEKYTVQDASKDTLLDRLVAIAKKILDIVTFRDREVKEGETLADAMIALSFRLMEYNNKAVAKVEAKSTNYLVNLLANVINVPETKIKEAMEVVIAKLETKDIPTPPKNKSAIETAMFYVKYLPHLLLRDELKHHRVAMLKAMRAMPEGFIQNVLRDFGTPDALERAIEKLGLAADMIDQSARSIEATVSRTINIAFSNKLTDSNKVALTKAVLDTDLQSVYFEYTNEEVQKLFSDEKYLEKQIKELKAKLPAENKNWYVNQAYGLANYMNTGLGGIAQYLNAYNIVKEVDGTKADEKVVDQLVTLIAIQKLDNRTKKSMAKLTKNKKGMDLLVELHKDSVKDAEEKLFNSKAQMIKGYSKEVFADNISVVVRPLADKDKLEKEGYTLVRALTKAEADITSVPMGLYKSKSYSISERYRAATRLTSLAKRGTSVTDVAFMQDDGIQKAELLRAEVSISNLNKARAKVIASMKKGTYTPDTSNAVLPVVNERGQVVDYRYTMSKEMKEQMLEQDTRVDVALSRTIGSNLDKVESIEHNKAVLDVIKKDMEENYEEGFETGKNGMPYIKIEKDSSNEIASEVYKLLPEYMKQEIKRSEEKYIAVRQDMLLNYFGFRHASITNARLGSIELVPKVIRPILKTVEELWKEFMKIEKVNIVIRIPSVLLGNILSNTMYIVAGGVSPIRVAKMQMENARWLREYLNTEEELREAKLLKQKGRIAKLEKELERNPVKELMDAGMYQAIIEDIGKSDFESSNKISRWVDNKTKGLPQIVRDGANWLFLTEKTSYFRFITQATQYSDFVARATQNQILKEKGVSKEKRMQLILDAFVNYNKPATSIEEWFNQVGLIMFTKYAKRVQRAIAQQGKEHPIKVLLMILGQEWMGVDLDDIYDQSVVTRNWYNIGLTPIEHIYSVATPAAIDIARGKY